MQKYSSTFGRDINCGVFDVLQIILGVHLESRDGFVEITEPSGRNTRNPLAAKSRQVGIWGPSGCNGLYHGLKAHKLEMIIKGNCTFSAPLAPLKKNHEIAKLT